MLNTPGKKLGSFGWNGLHWICKSINALFNRRKAVEVPAGMFWVITMDVKCLHYRFADKAAAVMSIDAHNTPPNHFTSHSFVVCAWKMRNHSSKEAKRQMEVCKVMFSWSIKSWVDLFVLTDWACFHHYEAGPLFPGRFPGGKVVNVAVSLQNVCYLQDGDPAPAGRATADTSRSLWETHWQTKMPEKRNISFQPEDNPPYLLRRVCLLQLYSHRTSYNFAFRVLGWSGILRFWGCRTIICHGGSDQVEFIGFSPVVDVVYSVRPASDRLISLDEIILRCNVC